jgi:hypothetical protein
MDKITNQIIAIAKKYINWADRCSKNLPIDKKQLSKNVEKGHFKTVEDAEKISRRSVKVFLLVAPVFTVFAVGFFVISGEIAEISDSSQDTSAVSSDPTPKPAENPVLPESETSISQNQGKSDTSSEPEEILNEEIEAQIQKNGADFQYNVKGSLRKEEEIITVEYSRQLPRGTQLWEVKFDLNNRAWTDSVTEDGETFDGTEGRFTVEQTGDKTTLYADSLDTDGSVVQQNAYIVTYPNK